jgi:hypothetical protein
MLSNKKQGMYHYKNLYDATLKAFVPTFTSHFDVKKILYVAVLTTAYAADKSYLVTFHPIPFIGDGLTVHEAIQTTRLQNRVNRIDDIGIWCSATHFLNLPVGCVGKLDPKRKICYVGTWATEVLGQPTVATKHTAAMATMERAWTNQSLAAHEESECETR